MGWNENAVYVHYLDHVLVQNSCPTQYDPIEREALGWLVKQDEKAIWIVTDRAFKPVMDHDSGLVILKSDVLALRCLDESDVKYDSPDSHCCRVSASRKGSEKLDPHNQMRKEE